MHNCFCKFLCYTNFTFVLTLFVSNYNSKPLHFHQWCFYLCLGFSKILNSRHIFLTSVTVYKLQIQNHKILISMKCRCNNNYTTFFYTLSGGNRTRNRNVYKMQILCVVIFNFSLRLWIIFDYLNLTYRTQILSLLKQLQNFWNFPMQVHKTGYILSTLASFAAVIWWVERSWDCSLSFSPLCSFFLFFS